MPLAGNYDFDESEPSEEDIIQRSKTNYLYSHEFKDGRFFQVIHADEDGFEVQLAPRTMFKAVYIKEKNDIEGIEIIKLINDVEKQRVKLSKFNFAQLKAFLKFIDEIDLKGITERRIKLADEDVLDEATMKKVKALLSKEGGKDVVESLIYEGIITSHDIVNTGFRKRGLDIYNNFLTINNYWKKYAKENEIEDSKEELVLQYFFEKNEWIFGYGLDYRFQKILQKETILSDPDLDGTDIVKGDYLLGDKQFTTFVELKKPSTPLFKKSKNRSNTWLLSNDLLNSVSQILEQKSSGLIKLDKINYDKEGKQFSQKAYDSKVILIIGSWSELDDTVSQKEREIKKKTLELFRRDSRNIDIITYDELFERAKYIVEGDKGNN